jgi:hypothetical protein
MDLLNIIQNYLRERDVVTYMATSTWTPAFSFWLIANGHSIEEAGPATVLLGDHLIINMHDPESLAHIYEVVTTITGELHASQE